MRYRDIQNLMETASAGATGAGNIATVAGNGKTSVGTIGAGFDADGDYGIYPKPKKKKKKTASVIRR